VGPGVEVDGTTPMRLRPALVRAVLVAVAMFAILVGGGVTAIWLVLAPVMPARAASTQLRQPGPSEAVETGHGVPNSGLTVIESDAPATTPPNTYPFSISW
jgi:hypothetical protein